MKKVNLNNLYESALPPQDTRILWVDKDESIGDIRAIHRYKNGEWNPYLVSVDYLSGSSDGPKVYTVDPRIAYYTGEVTDGEDTVKVVGVVIPDYPDELITITAGCSTDGYSLVSSAPNFVLYLFNLTTTEQFSPDDNHIVYIANNEYTLANNDLQKTDTHLVGCFVTNMDFFEHGEPVIRPESPPEEEPEDPFGE